MYEIAAALAAMTRSLTQLEEEVKAAGIALPSPGYGKKELVELLKQHYWSAEHGATPQPKYVDPMLLRNIKDVPPQEAQRMWESEDYYVEQKRDGLRAIIDFDGSGKPRAYSRNVSVKTYSPSDLTKALFWIPTVPELANTALDGEVVSSVAEIDTSPFTKGGKGTKTKNVLQVAVALTGMANTKEAQEALGMPLRFVVYDIVTFAGEDMSDKPYTVRRDAMAAAMRPLSAATDKVELNATTNKNKRTYFDEIIERGGEGVVMKHKDLTYQQGKRPSGGWKVKAKDELDAVVTAALPPQSGAHLAEGLVGGFEVSAKDINSGQWIPVASFSSLDLATRREVSEQNPDGTYKGIKPGVIGEWIYEVEFRGWSKNYRMMHARPLRRRDGEGADSKSVEDCTFDYEAVKASVDAATSLGSLENNLFAKDIMSQTCLVS